MSLILSCREATALLTEEAEGALKAGDRAKLAVHFTLCHHCRAFRVQYERTIDVLRAAPREASSAEDVDAILKVLEGEEPGRDGSS